MALGRIVIVGGGKVGRCLHRAARAEEAHVTLVGARRLDRRTLERGGPPSLVVLAVRDTDIGEIAESVASALAVTARARVSIVHTSGRFGSEVLEGARAKGVAVGQMHPLLSFVAGTCPVLGGATLLIGGDTRASRACRSFARTLGMVPRSFDRLPRPLYHAAAALVANSAAALAEAATELLEAGGVPRKTATAMIGPLLGSVAHNVTTVGLPEALSGPVRRGDATAVARHLEALSEVTRRSKKLSWIGDLYRAGALAQIPLSRALREASEGGLREIQERITHDQSHASGSALRSRKR